MKNLEQIRAASAIQFWKYVSEDTDGEQGGDVIRGLSSLVINNGLLATLAFATEKKGYKTFGDELGRFITKPELGIFKTPATDVASFMEALSRADSLTLQRATTEALAYIGYLKRLRLLKKSS